MAAPDEPTTKYEERKKQVLLELPVDFLRIGPAAAAAEQQLAADEQTALALQHQMAGASLVPPTVSGRLSISIMEARLVKNYGMTRMDPYVRLKVGNTIYETHTDYNGAKNPKWHKVFHRSVLPNLCWLTRAVWVCDSFIMTGVDKICVEIFDECAFTLDERIAWAIITIPEAVFKGESIDQWFPLTGKQGEEKEGTINILLSYQASPGPQHASPLAAPR
ncbi:TOLLIP, partial [Cordylochernes scorpioides]